MPRGAPAFLTVLLAPSFLASQPVLVERPSLLDAGVAPLRWENVEGRPYRAGGAAARWSLRAGCDIVLLDAGESVSVIVPAGVALRIHSTDGPLDPSDLEVWSSDGFGLDARVEPIQALNEPSLIVPPFPFHPSLVEIARPPSKEEPIEIALFISRVEHRPAEDLHRTLVPLPVEVVRISSAKGLPGPRHWLLDAGKTALMTLDGPARFALVTRVVFPAGEASPIQGLAVKVAVDGRTETSLIETLGTAAGLSWIGSKPVLLGEERAVHFEVPAGSHEVTIESSLTAYSRLLRRSPADFLLSDEPAAGPSTVFGRGSPDDSLGFLLGPQARGVLRPEGLPIPGPSLGGGLERRTERGVKLSGPEVVRILRDASRRENGLLGAMYCRDLAAGLSTHPDDRAVAALLYRRHVQYRSLLPLEMRTSSPQRSAWFAPRRLAAPDEGSGPAAILEEHLASAAESLSSGFFLEAPRSRDTAHVFALPERFAPSLLRVVVELPAPPGRTDLLIEADDGKRTHLRLRGGDGAPDFPSVPSRAEAALGAILPLHGAGGSTVHGPLAASGFPAPFIDATAEEIPLPATVRQVRLWAEGTSFRPRVALQYLGERAHEPTELEYMELLRHVEARDPLDNPFCAAFKEWSRGSWPEGVPLDLVNVWIPLFRALGLARGRVLAGAPAPARPLRRVDPAAGASPAMCAAGAEALEKDGHWLPALEAWAGALASPERETYRRARLGMIDALEALGEQFLAASEVRGLLLHEEDERLRHDALERIAAARAGDPEDLSRTDVLAFLAVETGDPTLLRELAAAFAGAGDHLAAIHVGLSLPAEELPIDALLRSTFRLRWWRLFESLCDAIEDSEEWNRWRGLRSAAAGERETALRHFAAAGARGVDLERSLRGALAIRAELETDDPERRSRAVLAWEAWQAERPGPMAWVDAPALVTGHAGAGAAHNEARNLHVQYYRAGRGGPLRIEALGPASLRIEARPIHARGSCEPLDGWLLVRERDVLHPVPITGNLPARGFALIGSPEEVPGGKVVHDFKIGPGLHRIEVVSPGTEVLARVFVLEPEFPLGVLPPLTPATLEMALHGPGGGAEDIGPPSGSVRVVSRVGAAAIFPVHRIGSLARRAAVESEPRLAPLLAARIALREGSERAISAHAEGLREVAGDRGIPVEERFLALSRLGSSKGPAAGAESLGSELEPGLHAAFLAAAGRLGEAIRVPGTAGEDAISRRMALLVHAAEKEPELGRVARVLGESLFREYPAVPGLQGLYLRLARDTAWRHVESFRDSAGVRQVDVPGASPESPELRARQALLPPFDDDERLVAGDGRLVASFVNSRPVVLELEMRLEAVEFVPRRQLRACYAVDRDEPREIPLSPDEGPRSFSLLVPEGEHSVRIWIDPPAANHYLRLRMREEGGGAVPADVDGPRGRRLYAMAVAERALRLAVEGPATLRFDELRDGRTITTYRHVLEGLHEIDFAPHGGRRQALVRVFERVESDARREPAPGRPPDPVDVVPAPLVDLEPRADRIALRVEDAFMLGGQEDGTLFSGVAFHHVELSSEDPDASGVSDFFEGTAGFRRRHELISTYSETGVLGRSHLEGGPTIGLWEDLFHEGDWLPFALRVTGTGYLQWPEGGALEPAGSPEWSLTLRGSASRRFPLGLNAYHAPSASIFGRLLSLHDGDEYAEDLLDPDVFTEYKDDHKAGLTLSETVGYRPWLDTEWWGRAALTSNQNLNPADPDHVSGWVGWKQYWNGWQFDVAFRTAWFFGDDDRSETRDQQTIAVQALRDWWIAPSHRLETAVEFRHDFPDNRNSGFILIVWHFGNGRGYRDHRPGTVDFLPLRLASMPRGEENRIEEAGRE